MNLLAEVLGWSQNMVTLWGIVFLRVGAMAALLPGFGENSIPIRIKLAIGICFTFIVAPSVYPDVEQAVFNQSAHTLFLFSEPIIGLILGIGTRLFILALQTAGAIAAQATSLSQLFGGAGLDPLPALGHILVVAGLALAVMMNLHVHIVRILVMSYEAFPVGEFVNASWVSQWGIFQVKSAFSLAFVLAAPFFIGSVIYNAALGIINKAMPQLMVAFVGAPAITGASIFLLAISCPFILALWLERFGLFLANPLGL